MSSADPVLQLALEVLESSFGRASISKRASVLLACIISVHALPNQILVLLALQTVCTVWIKTFTAINKHELTEMLQPVRNISTGM